jgi:hypothetical protein
VSNETEFVDGFIVKAPRDGAPDFVKGSVSIKNAELIAWLKGRTDERTNLDIKESKGGKWYAAVNTYKPKDEQAPKRQQPAADPFADENIPF